MGVMLLVQAVYNVQTQLALVLAMLVIKKPNVILLVVVIQLDQAAQHVISPQVNVHAMRDTQEPHVASVTLTTIERAMELAEVRNNQFTKDALDLNTKFMCFQLVVVMPPVLVICNVRILLDSAPALLVIRVQNVILLVVVIPLVWVVQFVIR